MVDSIIPQINERIVEGLKPEYQKIVIRGLQRRWNRQRQADPRW